MLTLEGSPDQTSCKGSFTVAIPIIDCDYWWLCTMQHQFLPPNHSTFSWMWRSSSRDDSSNPSNAEPHFSSQNSDSNFVAHVERWFTLMAQPTKFPNASDMQKKYVRRHHRDEGCFYDARFSLTMFLNNNLRLFRRNFWILFFKGCELWTRPKGRRCKTQRNL